MSLPHPDGLLAAKACATAGRCIFCEEPLGPYRTTLCGSRECRTAYHRAYRRDRRLGIKMLERRRSEALAWCAGGAA